MALPGTILQNRYRIERPVAKGGMGAVFEAIDQRLKTKVAVKETFLDTPEMLQAFEREARLLAGLRHQGLPKVIDHFTESGGQFLVMEYVEGDDLSRMLAARGLTFPQHQVLAWADQLLSVLEYLHAKHIVHRDIKPANIKLSESGHVILLDFGLAKGNPNQASRATGASVQAYTPGYAPLEQVQGTGTDERGDLFAVGATLHHLLTGAPPPDALTRAMSVLAGRPDPLRPVSDFNPEIPEVVCGAILTALSLDRERRPASAAEMRRMLLGMPTPPSVLPAAAPTIAAPTRPAGAWTNPIASEPTQPEPPLIATQPRRSGRFPWIGVSLIILAIAGIAAGVGYKLGMSPARPTESPTAKLDDSTSKSTEPDSERDRVKSNPPTGKPPSPSEDKVGDVLGMEFVEIPAGDFQMGDDFGESDERPAHHVVFSEPFLLGKFEVTQRQWKGIMGDNPSRFRGDDLPVDSVTWNAAAEFIRRLNEFEGTTAYRLPTEAEWEYACRGGASGEFSGPLDDVGWIADNSGGKTHPVGRKRANRWGLHDMQGNVWEWCRDRYHANYQGAPSDGSAWETGTDSRVLRGGSWYLDAASARWSNRNTVRNLTPELLTRIGLRVAKTSSNR